MYVVIGWRKLFGPIRPMLLFWGQGGCLDFCFRGKEVVWTSVLGVRRLFCFRARGGFLDYCFRTRGDCWDFCLQIFSESGYCNPNLDCIYTFPIAKRKSVWCSWVYQKSAITILLWFRIIRNNLFLVLQEKVWGTEGLRGDWYLTH